MLKFARKNRSGSVDRTSVSSLSPPLPVAADAAVNRKNNSLDLSNYGPAVACVDEVDAAKQTGRISVRLLINQGSSDYETVYSGTYCRPNAPPKDLAAPQVQTRSAAPVMNEVQRSALKKNLLQITAQSDSIHNPGYDFHRAIEKLVEKMDLGLQLDTSSESGYGSDQDSLKSGQQADQSTANPPPTLPPRASPGSSTGQGSGRPPLPPPRAAAVNKKRVQFDSYVLFLQGLRERDLEMVQAHVREVCDAALSTDEVVAELMSAVIEGHEGLVRELLVHGADANANNSEMTPLHLAAAFNNLSLVRLLLSYGAAVFTRAHSSGKLASELCSRQLPGYQACHAYLRCMEECLGVANSGRVYASQAHRTSRGDELELEAGQELVVVRKGDYSGSAWWWCSNSKGQQGYVLQDFLSLNKAVTNRSTSN